MKRIFSISIALAALTLSITSCSESDDDSSNNACQTCSITAAGVTASTEYCDNGDGTMTVTTNGVQVSSNQAIPGGNFSTYITSVEAAGGSCN